VHPCAALVALKGFKTDGPDFHAATIAAARPRVKRSEFSITSLRGILKPLDASWIHQWWYGWDFVEIKRLENGTALPGALHDHSRGDGFVGAGVDEHEGAGVAVAAVGVVDEGDGISGSK
jgi:hypothetical protein